jgi:hypothetical protein
MDDISPADADDPEEGNGMVELFDKYHSEYLKFERIPESERRHVRPDLCAILYLHERLSEPDDAGQDAVCGAEHDVFYLDWSDSRLARLTERDVIYVSRCGVCYSREFDCLMMFV